MQPFNAELITFHRRKDGQINPDNLEHWLEYVLFIRPRLLEITLLDYWIVSKLHQHNTPKPPPSVSEAELHCG